MARGQCFLLAYCVATASGFAALPHLPSRHHRAVVSAVPAPPATAIVLCSGAAAASDAAAALPPPKRWWAKVVAAVAVINLTGLEYLGYGALVMWGSVCVGVNYFLWIFRRAIELSGLAPESWDPENKGPTRNQKKKN